MWTEIISGQNLGPDCDLWLHWNIILWNSQMISCKTSVRLARLCVDFNVLGSIQTSETCWDLNEFTSLKTDQWILLDSWMEVIRLPGNISLRSLYPWRPFITNKLIYPLNSLGYDVIVSCCWQRTWWTFRSISIKLFNDGTAIWRRQQQLSPGMKTCFLSSNTIFYNMLGKINVQLSILKSPAGLMFQHLS